MDLEDYYYTYAMEVSNYAHVAPVSKLNQARALHYCLA